MDVLMELFKYFYVDELFCLFNDVIHQFPLLLKKGNLQLHVRHIDAYFRKHILPNIEINNVISIRIKNMYHMAPVNLGQFNQVHLLILQNVTALNWPSDFPTNLKSLAIYARSKDREAVFKQALSLDNIERLEFNSPFLHFHDCHDILTKPSTIKHLMFNSQRCFIDYQFLLNNMPHLETLRSTNTYYPHRFNANLGTFTCLRTIDLICKHVDIDAMISFLTNIASNSLRRCRLINISSSLSTHIAIVLIS
ncbi:unnamed protein product [Rotaria sp. Silwood1]|nr:unnamed protein product [Rotaria sp. Silwood1]CAF3449926.1 unnamed protein product [Rotaria sp. Silwood1]CAF4586702.1 unnamed protein product [Rotaria sp. Silwood1]